MRIDYQSEYFKAPTGEKGKIIDSAVVIGIFTGVCYSVGYLVRTEDSRRSSIPYDFLPRVTFEETALYGFLLILMFCIIGTLLVALAIFLFKLSQNWKVLSPRVAEQIPAYFLNRLNQYKRAYTLLFVLIVLVAIWTMSVHPPFPLRSYDDAALPNVLEFNHADIFEEFEKIAATGGL